MKKGMLGVWIGVVIDRLVKILALNGVMVVSENPGLYMIKINQTFIIFGSILTLIGLVFWMIRSMRKGVKDLSIGFLLIIFGGFSNLFDRLIYGYVIDMIPLLTLSVFNLADVMIVVGCVLIFTKMLKKNKVDL